MYTVTTIKQSNQINFKVKDLFDSLKVFSHLKPKLKLTH